jgi:hypothetical protein
MRKRAEQALFVLTCLVAAACMGTGWGALIYLFDKEVGLWIGLVFGCLTFLMLVCAGWDAGRQCVDKPNRRFDD